jgi:DNA primase
MKEQTEIPYFIECILKERKITDLLSSRGIYPSRSYGDKILYKCPIHDGDNDPSFIVFTGGKYESYKCFGCHSGINVINLLSALDKISLKDSIQRLAKGLDIEGVDVLLSSVKDTEKLIEQGGMFNVEKIEELSLKLNRFCYDYLSKMEFDIDEVNFFIEIYKRIDILTRSQNLKDLQRLYVFIIDVGIPYRINQNYYKKENLYLQGKL